MGSRCRSRKYDSIKSREKKHILMWECGREITETQQNKVTGVCENIISTGLCTGLWRWIKCTFHSLKEQGKRNQELFFSNDACFQSNKLDEYISLEL